MHSHESESAIAHRVPFGRFFLAVGVQFAAMIALISLVLPGAFRQEISQPWMIVLWTFLLGIPLSLFEYLYHRYLLHSAVLPFLGAMHRAHSTHHGLTAVKAPVTPKEPEKLVPVTSEFPVEEEHQEESMMFPLWSIPIFYGVFLILLALPLKLIFPSAPILVSLILNVTLYYIGYEVWHAILHLPFERFWKPMLEGRMGRLFKRMYSFHLMHHWRPTSNLAVVGFWGIALWDHVFRTHRRPERLPLDGAEVSFDDARLKRPLWPIAMLDRWQAGLYKWSRRVEAFLAKVFLRRRTSP
jgi:hemolysin III